MKMKIRLIRHATMQITIGGVKLLVDPLFSQAEAMEPISNSPNQRRNPLVPLPVSIEELLNADAILLTHTHRDHFDTVAIEMLPKDKPLFCQPADEKKLKDFGFTKVHAINERIKWQEITFIRTGGQHGTGDIGREMGMVSGYVLQISGKSELYIAGDTIWCDEVKEALDTYLPKVTVVFAGAAQFLTGDPITMTAKDIAAVCQTNLTMKVVTVHMEAFNHCLLLRKELKEFVRQQDLSGQVLIPYDGEEISF
jgi:L-ascorbate metabolism protein UlaG (beta-lactamase superfamily)